MVNVAIGFLLFLVLLWGAYSLFCILIPLKPFRSRGRAAGSFGASILALFSVGFILSAIDPSPKARIATEQTVALEKPAAAQPLMETEADTALTKNTELSNNIPAPCGDGGIAFGDVVAVNGEFALHETPSLDAPKIRNEKASLALGKDHFHKIDNSTTVRRLCVQSDWTEIQIVTPDWLTFVKGWVRNSALREIELTGDGARMYVEADFYWDDDTSKYKAKIIAVVNKIARENAKCVPIDPSSVAKSPSRSKPNDPVFFVTCGSGADVFNVWFRPKDADAGEVFAAREPLAKNAAADSCEMAAKQAAAHPSTVSFSRVWDLAYMPHASGRARVVSSFTAKNALNLELKYRIDCLFEGATLIEVNIAESFD